MQIRICQHQPLAATVSEIHFDTGEAKAIEKNLEEGVFYHSLVENIPEVQGKEEISYFMVVYSLPAEDFDDYDSEETEVFTVVKDKAVGQFKSLEGKEVERYEIYDFNTDDIHVMHRIPYKPPRSRPHRTIPAFRESRSLRETIHAISILSSRGRKRCDTAPFQRELPIAKNVSTTGRSDASLLPDLFQELIP